MADSTAAGPIVTVAGLNKWYGDFHVLRDIDLEVGRGERIVICGPSGSGKSTLIRCINALEEFQEGRIVVDGIELGPNLRRVHEVRREVGMVFQNFNLFPHLTALQNVMLALVHTLGIPPAQARERAMQQLTHVGLADHAHVKPGKCSGGQQQRIAIARALAMEPEVMLFDEPTSALDPNMTAEVLAVMTDLARDGQTMIVVTHAMGFARKVASVVHVFGEGRVIESGPPEQVFEAPAHEATRSLLAEVRAA